jgi:hypothetical protein
MGRWDLKFFVLDVIEVVGNTDFGEVKSRRVRLMHNNLVLNQKAFIHFLKAGHVPRNVVLDVLDAANLEYHELVDPISYLPLPLRLDV